jgi:putative peptide zinc metalloprotease protein
MAQGQTGRTVALWPEGARKPTRDDPQLSMVLVPRQAGTSGTAAAPTAPSWVFPFDKPAGPADDGNQSLAVNTTDGSVVYDVAFALVWADDGDTVNTKNEAYAFASCADCAAVAVGFQVVLIVGQTDVIVPENLSAAANYNCVRCLTYALASQLVLTLDGPLSADGMTKLNALWQQIADFGRDLRNVPLTEIQERLSTFKEQIMEVIKADPSATKRGSTGTAPTPGATTQPTPGSSAPPSPGVTEQAPPSGGTPTSGPAPAGTVGAPAPAPAPAQTGQPAQPAPSGTEPATAPAPTPGAASSGPATTAPPTP